MSETGPGLGLEHGWADGDSGWGSAMEANLLKLDALGQSSVISETNTPPGTPSEGDWYIVGTSPTGAWSGHAHAVVVWTSSAWIFYVPELGRILWNVALGKFRYFYGSGWQDLLPS